MRVFTVLLALVATPFLAGVSNRSRQTTAWGTTPRTARSVRISTPARRSTSAIRHPLRRRPW